MIIYGGKEVSNNKMRGLIAVAVSLTLLASLTPAYAKTPADKLTRGMANICGGFILEIPQTMGEEWKLSNNAAIGCLVGFFKGAILGICRLGSGLWDLLSFPVAAPSDYEPLFKPDYVFDKE